jgi:hypothetical protein
MTTTDTDNYRRLREAVGELLRATQLAGEANARSYNLQDTLRRKYAAWAELEAAYDAVTVLPTDFPETSPVTFEPRPFASVDVSGGGILGEGDGQTDPFAP